MTDHIRFFLLAGAIRSQTQLPSMSCVTPRRDIGSILSWIGEAMNASIAVLE